MGDVESILYVFIATYVAIAVLGHVLLITAIIKCWRVPLPVPAAFPPLHPPACLPEPAAAMRA